MATSEAIPVRKVELPFDKSIPKHWIDGSHVATHFFNGPTPPPPRERG